MFLQDLSLPLNPYAEIIASSIEQQIEDNQVADIEVGPAMGGPWAAADAPLGQSRSQLPEHEREKDARPWDWGVRENFEPASKRSKLHASSNGHVNGAAMQGKEVEKRADMDNDDEEVEGLVADMPQEGEAEDDLRVILEVSKDCTVGRINELTEGLRIAVRGPNPAAPITGSIRVGSLLAAHSRELRRADGEGPWALR